MAGIMDMGMEMDTDMDMVTVVGMDTVDIYAAINKYLKKRRLFQRNRRRFFR